MEGACSVSWPVPAVPRAQARGDDAGIHAPGGPYLPQVSLTDLAAVPFHLWLGCGNLPGWQD